MFTAISHVCIHVRDIAQTMTFYHEALGLPVQYVFHRQGVLFGAYFTISDTNFIEAFQIHHDTHANTGIVHVCLQTQDLDACMRQLASKGVACKPKNKGSAGCLTSWINDPDG
ncbi:MAG: VOC family protein, partial [Planctomycetota bacterium]